MFGFTLIVRGCDSVAWRRGAAMLLAVSVSSGLCRPAQADEHQERLRVFEQELNALHQRMGEPGLAVGVVHGGELSFFRGLGFADIAAKTPVTRDTPFRIASLTKTFASTVVLNLVDQGKIDLDRPVAEYGVGLDIPGFNVAHPDKVTTRHLMSHTAQGTPGESYAYNGALYSALSLLIEKTTGRSFFDEMQDLIVEPLGLGNTGRYLDETEVALASPYRLVEGKLTPGAYRQSYSAAAGMQSSVADLATYSVAIDHYRFLEKETRELAFTPMTSTKQHDLPYGLGWFVETFEGQKLIWHYGNWDCTSSLILKVPGRDLTLIALSNTDHLSRGFGLGGGSVLTSPLALAFLRIVADSGPPSTLAEAIDSAGAAAENAVAPTTGQDALRRELWANMLLSITVRNHDEFMALMKGYETAVRLEALDEHRGEPVVASIGSVGASADESQDFALEKTSALHVVAVGELGESDWADYAWIEDTASGQRVWGMDRGRSQHAGGAPDNRLIHEPLMLPPGSYVLRYRSDAAHDASSWRMQPPDGLFWGVTLFAAPPPVEQSGSSSGS